MLRSLGSLAVAVLLSSATSAAPVPAPDNRPTVDALRQAVEVLSKAGTDVRSRLGAGDDEQARVELWCEVAKLRDRLGDQSGVAAAVREARAIARVSQQTRLVSQWRDIAKTCGELGDAKTVADLAKIVPEKVESYRSNPRHTILREAAEAAARAGHLRAAEQIADASPDEATRKSVRAFVRLGAERSRLAPRSVADAMKAAEGLPTAAEKVRALVGRAPQTIGYYFFGDADGIAGAQLRAGDAAGAKRTALKALALLPDVDQKNRTATALAVTWMFCRLDDVASARKTLAQIPAQNPKGGADRGRPSGEAIGKLFIATAEVRAGRDEAATALLKSVSRSGDRARLLHFIAVAQGQAGRLDAAKANIAEAIKLLDGAPNATGGTTLHNVLSAQALAGDTAGAIRNARQYHAGVVTWANIVAAQLRLKDFGGARETAAAHIGAEDQFWYARTVRSIAQAQAGDGRAADVRAWAAKMDDGLLRANALLGLASGLYREPAKVAVKPASSK